MASTGLLKMRGSTPAARFYHRPVRNHSGGGGCGGGDARSSLKGETLDATIEPIRLRQQPLPAAARSHRQSYGLFVLTELYNHE